MAVSVAGKISEVISRLEREPRQRTPTRMLARPTPGHADVHQEEPNSDWGDCCGQSSPHLGPLSGQGAHPQLPALRLPPEPASQSFFKLFLSLWVSLGMSGTWQQFAPAVTVEQARDGAVIHMMPDARLERLSRSLPSSRSRRPQPGQRTGRGTALLLPLSDTDADDLPCLASPRPRPPGGCTSRSHHAPSLWRPHSVVQSPPPSAAPPSRDVLLHCTCDSCHTFPSSVLRRRLSYPITACGLV